MKKSYYLFVFLIAYISVGQIPSVDIKTLEGGIINTSDFDNDDGPIIISFWATWCKPCKEELENIHEVYEDWQEDTNVKLIAISIDDARNTSKIKPLVNAKGWEYEVYQDSNREFLRCRHCRLVVRSRWGTKLVKPAIQEKWGGECAVTHFILPFFTVHCRNGLTTVA